MSSDIELHGLYLEFADAQRGVGQMARAADSYALALYYAKRIGDVARVRRCREQVAVCNPDHVVCRESSAPLFFAQLLLRYPPEEVAERLEAMKSGVWLADNDPLASMGDGAGSGSEPSESFVDPMTYARINAADGIFETDYSGRNSAAPAAPTARAVPETPADPGFPRPEPFARLEPVPATSDTSSARQGTLADRHHLYVPGHGSTDEVGDFRMPRGFTTAVQPADDYQFAQPPKTRSSAGRPSLFTTGLDVMSVLTLVIGIISVGFFGSQIHPTLTRAGIDVESMLSRATGADADSSSEPGADSEPATGRAPGWRPADPTHVGSRYEKWSDRTQR